MDNEYSNDSSDSIRCQQLKKIINPQPSLCLNSASYLFLLTSLVAELYHGHGGENKALINSPAAVPGSGP